MKERIGNMRLLSSTVIIKMLILNLSNSVGTDTVLEVRREGTESFG